MGIFDFLFFRTAARKKGAEGERGIEKKLERANLFGYQGVCLKNLYVPLAKGGTTEIDLVYLTGRGIFVIESKNYSGRILGDEQEGQWSVGYYAGRTWYGRKKFRHYRLYNPIWQNKTHIRALRRYLKTDAPIFSFVVFSDDAELKKIRWDSEDVTVCSARRFLREFKRTWRQNPPILQKQEFNELHSALAPLTRAGTLTKLEHIGQQEQKLHSCVCPICGGRLVMRPAQKGPLAGSRFYGCENYPHCRYTRNL